jgi:type IV secretion system protein VirB2
MSKKILFFMAFLLLCSFSVFASTGTSMPWDDGLEQIQKALSGTTVKTIGLIMIIGAGIALAFTEGQAIKKIFWIVIGLGIALNAASFVAMIFGSTAGLLLHG